MKRFRADDATAFAMLVESSQTTNIKLHAVATWLVGDSEDSYANDQMAGHSPR